MKSLRFIWRAAALFAVIALSLIGASKKHEFSPHEKAFYAERATVEFVNPGLTITVVDTPLRRLNIASCDACPMVFTGRSAVPKFVSEPALPSTVISTVLFDG